MASKFEKRAKKINSMNSKYTKKKLKIHIWAFPTKEKQNKQKKTKGRRENANQKKTNIKTLTMTVHFSYLPAILEPHFDLLLFNVGKDGALPNELLPSGRTRLGALSIHPLQSLHLFRCVPHILATIHEPVQNWISLHTKCHNNKAKTLSDSKRDFFWVLFFLALFTQRASTLLHQMMLPELPSKSKLWSRLEELKKREVMGCVWERVSFILVHTPISRRKEMERKSFFCVEQWMQTRKNKQALQKWKGWLEQWWLLKFTWIFCKTAFSFSLWYCVMPKPKATNYMKERENGKWKDMELIFRPCQQKQSRMQNRFFCFLYFN